MNKFVTTTTINPPTKAVKLYDSLEDWNLIVVGDEKTPKNYKLNNGLFLDVNYCKYNYKDLYSIIGTNNIDLGRMVGYIEAYKNGADVIATIDDDNIPLDNWGKDIVVGREIEVDSFVGNAKVFDPLAVTDHNYLWHRGFPLECIKNRNYKSIGKNRVTPLVQANLWNGDPDIDAICRKIYSPSVKFTIDNYFYGKDMICPFNTQNTIIHRSALKYCATLPFTGRMDDIWGAYLFQSKFKNRVVFGPATVFQERNPHNLNVDFDQEVLGYKYSYEFVLECFNGYEHALNYLPPKTKEAYAVYQKYFD